MSEIDLLIQELRDTIDNQKEEIDRLNNLNKQLVEECQILDDEETRLNNIINELEKVFIECDYQHLQRKLKELKENNK